jgi:hypothetical protein
VSLILITVSCPAGATTLSDRLLVEEYVMVQQQQASAFARAYGITVAADTWTNARKRAVYAATATTAQLTGLDRKAFLLEVKDCSSERHTAENMKGERLT